MCCACPQSEIAAEDASGFLSPSSRILRDARVHAYCMPRIIQVSPRVHKIACSPHSYTRSPRKSRTTFSDGSGSPARAVIASPIRAASVKRASASPTSPLARIRGHDRSPSRSVEPTEQAPGGDVWRVAETRCSPSQNARVGSVRTPLRSTSAGPAFDSSPLLECAARGSRRSDPDRRSYARSAAPCRGPAPTGPVR